MSQVTHEYIHQRRRDLNEAEATLKYTLELIDPAKFGDEGIVKTALSAATTNVYQVLERVRTAASELENLHVMALIDAVLEGGNE